WADYSGSFTWTGAAGYQDFAFQQISTGPDAVPLDAVHLQILPILEFESDAASGEEEAPAIPGIIVSGNVDVPFTVPITIIGGSAEMGVDYLTPTGTYSFTVSIPAGTYTGVVLPLGVSIVN